jgi:hypothetical protein
LSSSDWHDNPHYDPDECDEKMEFLICNVLRFSFRATLAKRRFGPFSLSAVLACMEGCSVNGQSIHARGQLVALFS